MLTFQRRLWLLRASPPFRLPRPAKGRM